ncbi:hypothetical protein D3C72_1856790 [compost metagenome]
MASADWPISITNSGPATLATWPRLSAIMVITRNSERVTEASRSMEPSFSRTPARGRRLRIATPSSRHQRKLGRVTAPSPNNPASTCPATSAARVAASTVRKLPAVAGAVVSSPAISWCPEWAALPLS